MRIVYVCADRGIPLLGDKGASVHLRSLAAALARRGHWVTLGARRLEGANAVPAGVQVERMPDEEEEHREWLLWLNKESRADVVLERYSLSSGPALQAAGECGMPFVLEVNAPLVDEAARYRGLDGVEHWRSRERTLLAASNQVIVVSSALQQYAIRMGVAADRVTVIPNGVDPEAFGQARGDEVRSQHRLGTATVVGFAGSLKPWHGVRELVAAFALLPRHTRLLIVGDGPERNAIEAEVSCGLLAGRVVLTGAVLHAQMPPHLAAMDIAVAPYAAQPEFYFSPLKVVEYLAAGLPVVATAQGDLPGLVGKAGLLVPPGSVDALRAALTRLIDDPNLRTRMSQQARQRAADFSWDAAARRVEGVLSPQGALA